MGGLGELGVDGGSVVEVGGPGEVIVDGIEPRGDVGLGGPGEEVGEGEIEF